MPRAQTNQSRCFAAFAIFVMGFRQPVDQCLASEPQEMMAFPSELKDALPENWKKIADSKKNWQYLQYASNVAGNAPWGTRTRLLWKDYESSYIEEVREWLRNAGACPARGPASKTDMKKAAKKS